MLSVCVIIILYWLFFTVLSSSVFIICFPFHSIFLFSNYTFFSCYFIMHQLFFSLFSPSSFESASFPLAIKCAAVDLATLSHQGSYQPLAFHSTNTTPPLLFALPTPLFVQRRLSSLVSRLTQQRSFFSHSRGCFGFESVKN